MTKPTQKANEPSSPLLREYFAKEFQTGQAGKPKAAHAPKKPAHTAAHHNEKAHTASKGLRAMGASPSGQVKMSSGVGVGPLFSSDQRRRAMEAGNGQLVGHYRIEHGRRVLASTSWQVSGSHKATGPKWSGASSRPSIGPNSDEAQARLAHSPKPKEPGISYDQISRGVRVATLGQESLHPFQLSYGLAASRYQEPTSADKAAKRTVIPHEDIDIDKWARLHPDQVK